MTGSEERLVKFLSAAGVASGDLVKAGRIAVNGRTIREPGFRILPADTVTLDGRPVEPAGRFHYIMLNKPRGYVCTNADPHAPRKAVDLIRLDPPVRLFSAGRLDKESEGMILFSNDGDYVARLTHPRYEIRKTYLVRVTREFTEPELTRIRTGITDGGEHLRVISIAPAGNCLYRIVLNEGKKREIRRLTAAVGSPTLELRRIRIGGLALGDLPQGAFRELTPEEVALTLEAHS